MKGIDKNYIKTAILDLSDSLGVKDRANTTLLLSLIKSNKVRECIKEIAKHLGLPIDINLSYVPRSFKSGNTNTFNSTQLVKTDWRGRGNEGITAQVIIPNDLPMYGSPGLINYKIDIRISENCTDSKLTFISVIAHELSHIVLHSLRHKEKDNEIYTDITAMLLGFYEIMNNGRKIEKTITRDNSRITRTTTYGYLNDSHFQYAFYKIKDIVCRFQDNKTNLIDRINRLKKQLKKKRETIRIFNKYIAFLDKNSIKKINQQDAIQLSAIHQEGYLDEFTNTTKSTAKELNRALELASNQFHYSDRSVQQNAELMHSINISWERFMVIHSKVMQDVRLMSKYCSLLFKLKVFFNLS